MTYIIQLRCSCDGCSAADEPLPELILFWKRPDKLPDEDGATRFESREEAASAIDREVGSWPLSPEVRPSDGTPWLLLIDEDVLGPVHAVFVVVEEHALHY